MALNKPGNNNGHDLDPWGRSVSNRGRGTKNNSKNNLNINYLITKLGRKLINIIVNVNNKNSNQSNNQTSIKLNKSLISFIITVIVIVLILSGFYTIKESDRGVVFRFGKYSHTVEPGLNWKPIFIEKVIPVNIETIREQATHGMMLTADENVIHVEMNVQYRVIDPTKYLFNVVKPDNSLRQAIESTVRGIIGQSAMEQVLTTKRTFIRDETQKELEKIIKPYNMGISILDVNFQAARPPEAVKAAFDDVIAAREEEQKTIREAQAYRNEVLPLANGNAQKLLEEAKGYKSSIVFKAEGEVASFAKILPEYLSAPQITKERLYIETMERILRNTRKVIINDKSNSLLLLPVPVEQILCNRTNDKSRDIDTKKNIPTKVVKLPTQQQHAHAISSNNESADSSLTRDNAKNKKDRDGNAIRVGRQY